MPDEQERVTVRVPPRMVEDLDNSVENGIYSSRSEAIRDGIRRLPGVCEPVSEVLR